MEHTIPPVFDKNSRVLVLGSFPSPKSRETGFFYGHPQNRFWSVIAAVFGESIPQSVEQKCDFLLSHGIAMWDVCRSCDIVGASDSTIKNVVANDFSEILKTAKIRAVFCTGKTATRLYMKYCFFETGIEAQYLPSTSAANRAGFDIPKLIEKYKIIADVLKNEAKI